MNTGEYILAIDDNSDDNTSTLRKVGRLIPMRLVDTDETLFSVHLSETVKPGNIIAIPRNSATLKEVVEFR